MVVNKNALHEVIMNYIPKKNTEVLAPPPVIFKGPIPTLGQPLETPQMPKAPPSLETTKEKVIVVKKTANQQVKPIDEEPKPEILLGGKSKSKKKTSTNRSKRASKKKPTMLESLINQKERHDFIEELSKKSNGRRNKTPSRHSKRKSYKKGGFIGIEHFDVEPKAHKNPFREVEVKLSSKKKKKSSKKVGGGSKKKGSSAAKKKKSSKSTVQIKKSAPSYLRYDIEKLLENDNNIAFHRIFT